MKVWISLWDDSVQSSAYLHIEVIKLKEKEKPAIQSFWKWS